MVLGHALKVARNIEEAELLLGAETAERCGLSGGAERHLLRRAAGVAGTLVRALDTSRATADFRSEFDGCAVELLAVATDGACVENDGTDTGAGTRYAARARSSI